MHLVCRLIVKRSRGWPWKVVEKTMSERIAVEQKLLPDLLGRLSGLGRRIFLAGGILPIVLVVAVVGFAIAEPRFLTYNNLFNVARA